MCEVQRKGFSKVISDNDEVFLRMLIGVVESVDELSSLEISKTPYSYHFRIAPSIPKYINHIMHEITTFNNLYGIKLDFSKSIKTTAVITFNIQMR